MPPHSFDLKPSTRTLGFLARAKRGGGRYGVTEAESGLLKAIADHSSWDMVIVWSETDLPDSVDPLRVERRSLSSLKADVQSGNITLLHHVGLGPANLTSARYDVPIPIFTSIFPALSYEDQMGQHALEALVRKTTHDTDIYPSECSREARLALLAQLEDGGIQPNGQTRNLVIPVGIDIDRFAPCSMAEKAQIRAEEGLADAACIAVVLTRFSPSDKADLFPLLWACASSPPSDGILQFLLLGSDDYHGAKGYVALLERYIAELGLGDAIKVMVVCDRDRTVQILRCADLFVSPADSVQETFGITPIEAMACGLPVIVSDWNGYRETVINDVTGYRIPTTFADNSAVWDRFRWHSDFRKSHLILSQSVSMDCTQLVSICRSVAASPERREQLGSAARRHAVDNFGWRPIIGQYDEAWGDVTEARFATDRHVRTSIDYFGAFSRYATFAHDDEALRRLTPLGQQVASGKFTLPLLSDMMEVLNVVLLKDILVAFQTAPQSVRSLNDLGSSGDIRFCVSWLAKQGFLEAADPPCVGKES